MNAPSGFEVSHTNVMGLNSSQPIIINKTQHNLDLNTNLRQVNKNRSQLVDQLTNPQNLPFNGQQAQPTFTNELQSSSTKNMQAQGDRV